MNRTSDSTLRTRAEAAGPAPAPVLRPEVAPHIRSAVSVIGAEFAVAGRELAVHPGRNAIALQRLQTLLLHFPRDASPPVLAEQAITLAGVNDAMVGRNDPARSFELARSRYDRLNRLAVWSDRPEDLNLVEFDAKLTGYPKWVVEAVASIDRSLVVTAEEAKSKSGFGRARSVEELDGDLNRAGSKLVMLDRSGTAAGFYVLYADCHGVPPHVASLIERAAAAGLLDSSARFGWCELVGVLESHRIADSAAKLRSYSVFDAAVMNTLQAECVEWAFAVVRSGNRALARHIAHGWEETGVTVERHGERYLLLRRRVDGGAPISGAPPISLERSAFPTVPDRPRGDFADRTPYSHRPAAEAYRPAPKPAPYLSDVEAVDTYIRWNEEMRPYWNVRHWFCSDGFVIVAGSPYRNHTIRQVNARRDHWTLDGTAVRGRLEIVLAAVS